MILTTFFSSKRVNKILKLISQFQLIFFLFEGVQCTIAMYIVHWHCSIDYSVKLILVRMNICENCTYNFTLKCFLLNSFGEMLLGGLRRRAKENTIGLRKKCQILTFLRVHFYIKPLGIPSFMNRIINQPFKMLHKINVSHFKINLKISNS